MPEIIADPSTPVSQSPNNPCDCCPNCVDNLEEPESVVYYLTFKKLIAFYTCHDCLHAWYTTWAAE